MKRCRYCGVSPSSLSLACMQHACIIRQTLLAQWDHHQFTINNSPRERRIIMADEQQHPQNADYNLNTPIPSNAPGLRQGLTSYGDAHFSLFLRKVFIKALGYSEDALSRPIIGIVNTYSSFNPCHANIPQLIEATKRGVQLSGGLAMEFPTISLHESFASPTSMFLRNLMSMDTEEMVRAQPCDAVVLIGGKYLFMTM